MIAVLFYWEWCCDDKMTADDDDVNNDQPWDCERMDVSFSYSTTNNAIRSSQRYFKMPSGLVFA